MTTKSTMRRMKMGTIEKLTLASWRWSLIYDVVDVEEIPDTTR